MDTPSFSLIYESCGPNNAREVRKYFLEVDIDTMDWSTRNQGNNQEDLERPFIEIWNELDLKVIQTLIFSMIHDASMYSETEVEILDIYLLEVCQS